MAKKIKEESTSENNYTIKNVSGMYKEWFLDYASYVILERAVPNISDGLKPVQRRILHSMKKIDDGRYNKVANIIGHTMQYHPHGDTSIGDALVQLGQKDLLIDTQGNWGNLYTGDNAAAPRYIEARLSKFATDVVFNNKTTKWKPSYDGRNDEPIHLPIKFPLLLAQGVEGIAVGLASKIMPHNFIELIDASINHLKGKKFELFPDFNTGGLADFSEYDDGKRGGKIKVRANIIKKDDRKLVINQIPFSTTTTSLINSILEANDKGKIKIKKIEDNTSDKVEIMIYLPSDANIDKTINSLFLYTNCEVSLFPNTTVIIDEKPVFIGVSDILKISTDNTLNLLKEELKIRKNELEENWHFTFLEKIFIENKIYNKIEKCETFESIIETIDKNLKPFKSKFNREITEDDIVKLTDIKIKNISKFNTSKVDKYLESIITEIETIKNNIENIVDYTVEYFKNIKKKYGFGKERKTKMKSFKEIKKEAIVEKNKSLYANYKDGFIGTSLTQDIYIGECSKNDSVIIFKNDGTYFITQVGDKIYIGNDNLYIKLWNKEDKTIYNAIYCDSESNTAFIKRFSVTGVIRDKKYNLTKTEKDSKVLWFSANLKGETENLKINLVPRKRMKTKSIDVDFSKIAVKGRNSIGNVVTKFEIENIEKCE